MKFNNSVVINRSLEKVFEFVTNFNNNAKWQTDILEFEMTTDGRPGLGSTYRCANRFMGKRIETEGIISEYVPDKTCSIQITSGPVRGSNTFYFEVVNGGTKVTASGDLDLAYFKLAKIIVKRQINQQLKKDMLSLKYILENGALTQEAVELDFSSAVR